MEPIINNNKIYRLENDIINFLWVTPVDENDFDILLNIEGDSVKTNWRELNFEFIYENSNDGKVPKGDFPNFMAGVLVFSKMAKDELDLFLTSEIEFLDIIIENELYYIANVVEIVDCLNIKKSKVKYFDNSKDIMEIQKYSLYKEKLINSMIFRIDNFKTEIFVSDQFKKKVESSNLLGFKFEEVYKY